MSKRSLVKDRVARICKRFRPTSNPFDQLDNAMLSFTLSFIDAADALRFAKTCQRHYNAFRACTKRRLFKDFHVICVTKSWPSLIDLAMRSSTNMLEPVRTYHLQVNIIEALLDDPDLVIVDGDIIVDVRFWEAKTNWAIYVRSGEEQDGVMCLLKFFAKHCRLDVLDLLGDTNSSVFNIHKFSSTKTLNYLAEHVPPHIRQVNFSLWKSTEEEMVEFLDRMPDINAVAFKETSASFSSTLFEHEAIRSLNYFKARSIVCEIADESLLALKWKEFRSEKPTKLTPNGVKAILEQWMKDERKIVSWTFPFYLNDLTFQEVVELLVGKRTENNNTTALLKSKLGKKLEVRMCLVVEEDEEDQVGLQLEEKE